MMFNKLDNMMIYMYELFVVTLLLGILAEVTIYLVAGVGIEVTDSTIYLADTEAYLIPAGIVLGIAFSVGIVCILYRILKYLIVMTVRFWHKRKEL